ncbi:protein-glutamate O-methyltransferase CheR [Aureimonas sp. AU22]|jgi:chemotaxis protein methyltransferase CheR|uniref:CheR family methyltransferase n=1 Tax=Aureimonas sp. AU22 TaxID=1638162 RepID=UPI000784920A|nr:CheR family methyltransferase [Aureimonas sp. AU22]
MARPAIQQPIRPAGNAHAASLDMATFRELARLVDESCGIVLTDAKRVMLETRLRRRLAANGMDDFRAYLALLRAPEAKAGELQAFTDCVVTNETSFFREPPHFEYLTPDMLKRLAEGGRDRSLRIWSAASSSGQEAYSLAMIADDASGGGQSFPWSVTATDISVRMLNAVREGVYGADATRSVPARLRAKYLTPVGHGADQQMSVTPDLRRNVRLGQINLMHGEYRPGQVMDMIFCRNVLIYFQPDVQLAVIGKLLRHLRPGGLLFLGHAESIRSTRLPLRLIRSNIYERVE